MRIAIIMVEGYRAPFSHCGEFAMLEADQEGRKVVGRALRSDGQCPG